MKLQANNIPSVVLLAFAAAAVVSWWPPTLFHHSVDAASGAFPTVKRGSMAEASSEDTPVGADIYTGPAIGSVAKVEWPELVNVNVDDAVVAIEQERPDLLMVNPTKEGSIVSMDYAVRRVRVFFDPDTRKVTRPPRVG